MVGLFSLWLLWLNLLWTFAYRCFCRCTFSFLLDRFKNDTLDKVITVYIWLSKNTPSFPKRLSHLAASMRDPAASPPRQHCTSLIFPNLATLVALLLLSHFSHVWLCATPLTAAHQASPSLGFSRQEHWSGLPFPSPMHESEKWKWSRSVVSDSSQSHGLQPTRPKCYNSVNCRGLIMQNDSCLLLLLSHFSRVRLCATP